jgi:hypothetical protein
MSMRRIVMSDNIFHLLPTKLPCGTCDEEAEKLGSWSMTLVGSFSPPGHDHDDNCVQCAFQCKNGHKMEVSLRRYCPAEECDWKGRTKCFCHEGEKLEYSYYKKGINDEGTDRPSKEDV